MTLRRLAALRSRRLLPVLRDIVLLLTVSTLVGGTGHAVAQTTQALLLQRREAYRTAKAQYDTASSAFRSFNRSFLAALDEVERARAAGDDPALERAYSVAQDRAAPLDAQERRLARLKVVLDSARHALKEVIERREEELVQQMEAATGAQQKNDLNTRVVDLGRELRGLEAEEGDSPQVEPLVGPLVEPDPRDGPADNLRKAGMLEGFAAQADTAIQHTNQSIQELQARLRRQQQRADLMAGLNRFDDTHLPVVTNAPPGDRSAAADSAGTGARPLTLQERIRALQDYDRQLESYRDKALQRAKEFRRRAGAHA